VQQPPLLELEDMARRRNDGIHRDWLARVISR
jgi:hypothetical protein